MRVSSDLPVGGAMGEVHRSEAGGTMLYCRIGKQDSPKSTLKPLLRHSK